MRARGRHKSFAEPSTHYHLIRSETPVSVDGFKLGEPTGEVECECCGAVAMNIDEIPHAKDCDQRFVRSAWWVRHLFDPDAPLEAPTSETALVMLDRSPDE